PGRKRKQFGKAGPRAKRSHRVLFFPQTAIPNLTRIVLPKPAICDPKFAVSNTRPVPRRPTILAVALKAAAVKSWRVRQRRQSDARTPLRLLPRNRNRNPG